ncbi:MAG TPA: DUF1153 domain-containing protein [Stellaceae bacterium]|jgi:hypothetical protein|nr:DUF1153 domain-containing protein [Stellaceae bacterium]
MSTQDTSDAASPATDEPLPPNSGRWVVRHKAEIIAAVHKGTLTVQEALNRYQLTLEEFLSWQRALEAHGVPGLRVTRLQIYRDTDAMRS